MKTITAKEFDRMFDDGEDISEYVDWSKARHANLELEHLGLDLPGWIVRNLEHHAEKLAMTRQELVQRWLEQRLQQEADEKASAAE